MPDVSYRRIWENLGGHTASVLVTLVTHLALVPLFLAAWGATRYGEWIVLTSLPGFFRLAEFGMVQAAAAPMTAAVVVGDRAQVFSLQNALRNFLRVSFGALTVAAGLWVLAGPGVNWLPFHGSPGRQIETVVLLMTVYGWLSAKAQLAATTFQAFGQTARGLHWLNGLRLFEAVACGIGVWLTNSVIVLSGTLVVVRALGLHRMFADMRQRELWNPAPGANGGKGELKKLVHPAVGFLWFPAAHACLLPGMAWVVQSTLGAAAVATYTTARTLARLLVQVGATINASVGPEYPRLVAAGRAGEAHALFWKSLRVSVVIGVVGGGVMFLGGRWLYHAWTGRVLALPASVWSGLLMAAAAGVVAAPLLTVLRATNRHNRSAEAYAIGAAVMCGVAWPAAMAQGLAGVAWSTVVAETAVLAVAIPAMRSLFQEQSADLNSHRRP